MKKIILLISLVTAFCIPSYGYATTISGTSCKTIKSTKIIGNVKYTCVKSKNKLIWNKGVLFIVKPASQPTPLPMPTIVPLPSSSPTISSIKVTDYSAFNDINECKISTMSIEQEHLGFPRPQNLIPTLGEKKAITLFVDFLDVPAEQKQIEEWKNNQIPVFEKYISAMSYGKLSYKVDTFDTFLHINKSVLSYNLDTPHGTRPKANADIQGLFRDAITLADPSLDFSQYEFINVVTPSTDKIGFEGTSGINFVVDGKSFHFGTFSSIRKLVDNPEQNIWLLHESGHMMGLMHPFNYKSDFPIWDAMGSGITPLPEFIGWERFLLNWLDKDNALCISNFSLNNYTFKLSSISNNSNGNKIALIKISDNEVLAIELHLSSLLSPLSNNEQGILIYKVNANIGTENGAISIITNSNPVRRNNFILGTIKPKEYVVSLGYKIEVLESDQLGYTIKINKI